MVDGAVVDGGIHMLTVLYLRYSTLRYYLKVGRLR